MKPVNWKTTAGAAVSAIGLAFLGYAGPALMGQDASFADIVSDPQFQVFLGIFFNGIGTMITGIFSRDRDKSSQDNGVRPDEAILEAKVAARVKAELSAAGIK